MLYHYPATRIYSVDCAVARCLSVCPSVRLSHTGILPKRLNISSKVFLPLGSHTILVVFVPNGMAIFRRGPLMGASNARGMKKSRFSTNISLYHRNDTRYSHSCHGMRIGNCTKLSSGAICSDLERPQTQISSSRHCLTLTISGYEIQT